MRSGRLTSEVVARGDVVAQDPVAVAASTGAAEGAVLTLLPSIGAPIGNGDVLYEANDRPVLAYADPIPLYRDLAVGDTGDDVARLQRWLIGLGVLGGDADGTYSRATGAALGTAYRARGYEPPPPSPTLVAELHDLEQQRAAIGANGEDGIDPVAAAAALDGQLATIRSRLAPTALRSELASVAVLPAQVLSVSRALGAPVAGEGPILTLSSGRVVVEIPFLDPGFDRFAGRAAQLFVDPAAPAPLSATLTATATRADESSVLVATSPDLAPEQVGRNVRVVIVDHAATEVALLVPAAAVVTRADGAAEVERRLDGGATERLAVTILGEAGGDVALAPADAAPLHEGDQVRIVER